jgi:antitoxin component of RelBE/YafQ-DinJ toxin-antitoxin module
MDKETRIALRIPEEERAKAEANAELLGISMSEYVRLALRATQVKYVPVLEIGPSVHNDKVPA